MIKKWFFFQFKTNVFYCDEPKNTHQMTITIFNYSITSHFMWSLNMKTAKYLKHVYIIIIYLALQLSWERAKCKKKTSTVIAHSDRKWHIQKTSERKTEEKQDCEQSMSLKNSAQTDQQWELFLMVLKFELNIPCTFWRNNRSVLGYEGK